MKIDAIELFLVSMPLRSPWRAGHGDEPVIESILVRMQSGQAHGWGESSPLATPTYSPEFARGVFLTVREHLAPRLLGRDIPTGEELQRLLVHVKGKRVKFKYRPGWALEMVEQVRRRFPALVCHVDCNSVYTLEDLDESITSEVKARQAAQLKACGWTNIKPGRVGGLTNALRIHDLCLQAGIPCWVGGMLESSLGAHQCLALATLPNFVYPNDLFPSEKFYRRDLCHPPMALSGVSRMTAPEGVGSGAEPNRELLQAQTLEHAVLPG